MFSLRQRVGNLWTSHGLVFRQMMLILLIVALFCAGGIVLLGVFLWKYKLNNVFSDVQVKGTQIASELDLALGNISRSADVIGTLVPYIETGERDYRKILETAIERLHFADHSIFGGSFAFLPDAKADAGFGMLYTSFTPEGFLATREVVDTEEPYYEALWFTRPQREAAGSWSEPYFDPIGKVVMTTYSAPIFAPASNNKEHFIGVFTVDISLDWLNDKLTNGLLFDKITEEHPQATHSDLANICYAFLLSPSGRLISHPKTELVNRDISELRHPDSASSDSYQEALRRLITNRTGFEPFLYSQVFQAKACVYYLPLNSSGWTLALVFNDQPLFRELLKMELIFGIGALVLLVGIAGRVTLSTVRALHPLEELSRAARKIGEGDFQAQLPVINAANEIGILAQALSDMQQALREYFAKIQANAQARERLESELKLASAIQRWLLPPKEEEMLHNANFRLAAYLEAARKVGGDLYDYYLHDNRLYLVIGDVSGKEISGALMMAVTQTLQRGYAAGGTISPGEAMTLINRDLNRNNELMMFVTLFLAVLDLTNGELRFCNAGHNPPYILEPDGGFRKLSDLHGPPLGITDTVYRDTTIAVTPLQGLLLYTDGVTEAQNPAQELFGNERLEFELQHTAHLSPEERIAHMVDEITGFRAGAKASDDTTMLLVYYLAARDRTETANHE